MTNDPVTPLTSWLMSCHKSIEFSYTLFFFEDFFQKNYDFCSIDRGNGQFNQ